MRRIDLHRHAGGSLAPETVWELIQRDSSMKNLAKSIDDLYLMMTYRNDPKRGFHHFLDKFSIQNHIKWTEEAIDLAVEQIVSDMVVRDNLDYCELRFSIDKYLNHIPWDETEACLFYLERLGHWSNYYEVMVGPVLSIKYESAWIHQKRTSKVINHWRVAEQLVGIDMVGNEAMFSRKMHRDIYRYWRACGKGLIAHAGESQGADNIKMAIEDLGVSRVAHGINIINDKNVMDMARDREIVFDIAISSNIMTGVVNDNECHPVRKMLDEGLIITIGTDDPVTFCTDIDKEYGLLQFAATNCDIERIKMNSVTHALTTLPG